MIGRLMQSAVKRMAKACGMRAVPRSARLSLETSLERWATRNIGGVIDVGASDGRWTELVMRHFPRAEYLLIEAQGGPHEARLRDLKRRNKNVDYLIAAAGDRNGLLHFDASDPFGGVASDKPFDSGDIEVPAVTVDRVVEQRGLPGPYLLKLDTHGFEAPIFEGARRTLEQTNLIIVEVYNFTLFDGALRFPQMCEFLGERGFRPLDLFDVMHRPKDGALWQFDLLLGRDSDEEFATNCYE
jgi:FkbM family methyltransferase